MKVKPIWWAIMLILGLSACDTTVPALEDKVLAIHDEIMPAVHEQLPKLRKSLSQKLDDSKQMEQVDTALVEKYYRAVQELDAADEAMMDWMKNYRVGELKQMDHAAATAYLTDQLAQITSIKTRTLAAIKQAEALIQ
jgi:hypothetical protein